VAPLTFLWRSHMATRRTTSDKRQRERAKQAKAAAKRARRQEKTSDETVETSTDDDAATTEQLLERIEALHASFDAGTLPFEEFEEQRSELVDQLAIRLAQ
jgi:hypothetical protein